MRAATFIIKFWKNRISYKCTMNHNHFVTPINFKLCIKWRIKWNVGLVWSLEYKLILQISEILSPGHYTVTVYGILDRKGRNKNKIDKIAHQLSTSKFPGNRRVLKMPKRSRPWCGYFPLSCIVFLTSLRRSRRCLSVSTYENREERRRQYWQNAFVSRWRFSKHLFIQ